jgi:hypothetical protein
LTEMTHFDPFGNFNMAARFYYAIWLAEIQVSYFQKPHTCI